MHGDQSMLKSSSEVIFIFPVWWSNVPAIIQSVKVITTGQAPKWYIQFIGGNGIKKSFIKATLKAVGMKNIQWLHCGYVSTGKNENRVQFLNSLPTKL